MFDGHKHEGKLLFHHKLFSVLKDFSLILDILFKSTTNFLNFSQISRQKFNF
jgi:hypothetical protein